MADKNHPEFRASSSLIHVSVIAIDKDLKRIWLNKSRAEGELGEWLNFGGSIDGDLHEEAVKMLAPYELWAQSLHLIKEHTSVHYESDVTDEAVIHRFITFAARIYTPYNDERVANDGDTILRAFSVAELEKLDEAGELIPGIDHFLPIKVRRYLSGTGEL